MTHESGKKLGAAIILIAVVAITLSALEAKRAARPNEPSSSHLRIEAAINCELVDGVDARRHGTVSHSRGFGNSLHRAGCVDDDVPAIESAGSVRVGAVRRVVDAGSGGC